MRSPAPPCPKCQSTNIGQPHYVGGPVLWFICRACAYVWPPRPTSTPPSAAWPLAFDYTVDAPASTVNDEA
jgi:hypothetical protein